MLIFNVVSNLADVLKYFLCWSQDFNDDKEHRQYRQVRNKYHRRNTLMSKQKAFSVLSISTNNELKTNCLF